MRLLVDTNILLDVLMMRQPLCIASAQVWTACETGGHHGGVSVISFSNCFYILRKHADRETAQRTLGLLQTVFTPVPLDAQLLALALAAGFADFEDAVQYHSATRFNADFLITRNITHFPKGPMRVLTPEEFLAVQATMP
jgi:hypothetical protein